MKSRILSLAILLLIIFSSIGCNDAIAPTHANMQPLFTSEIVAVTNGSLEDVKVHYIDVGQADSILIDINDYEILIDGGNKSAGQLVSDYISDKVDGNLEIVVATHVHADHIGGLYDIFTDYNVDKVIDSGQKYNSKAYKDYWSAVENSGATIIYDDDLEYIISENITFKIIECTDNEENPNNNSVVSQLNVGNIKILFVGDMESDIETRYINKFEDVDVLKVGHHGSRTSSSDMFLDKINPEYAVISVGKNNQYGHPHKETLDKYKERKIATYRTDIQGTIIATIIDDNISFNTEPLTYEQNFNISQQTAQRSELITNTIESTESSYISNTGQINRPKHDENISVIQDNAPQSVSTSDTPILAPTIKEDSPNSISNNVIVYKTQTGGKYHADGCRYLNKSKIETTIQHMKNEGLTPCSVCKPPLN